MSRIEAIVKEIQTVDTLNIVSFDFKGTSLTMMSLELKENIKVGKKVSLEMKPTTVAIGKEFSGEISYSNQIESIIESIDLGELLCSINLKVKDSTLESIITAKSAYRLNLQKGDKVTAIVKASEISISEVLDD